MRVHPETKKAMKRRSASKPPRRILAATQGDVKRRVGCVLPEPVHIGVSIRLQQGRKLGFRKRLRASAWRLNAPRSSSAVQVSEAYAAYSRSCPTMVRRISGFELHCTSAGVGTASWSMIT